MTDNTPELWFAFVCITLILIWIGAEVCAATPRWIRRLTALQRGRAAMAQEFAAKNSKRAMLRADSTNS